MSRVTQWILKMTDGVTSPLSRITGQADSASAKMAGLNQRISGTEGMFRGLGRTVAAIGLVGILSSTASKAFDVGVAFEKYNAVLTNTFQSSAMAASAMQMIQEFAAKTPYAVDELTASYIKLVNRGFVPTIDQMQSLGDMASSMGKSFDQWVEAILDAQTGEFERLKEFGVKAAVAGDKVTFMFRGQATTVAKTHGAMSQYLLGLGNITGIHNAMGSQMNTLGGKWSNLMDNVDAKLRSVMQSTRGFAVALFDGLNWLFTNGSTVKDILYGIGAGAMTLAAAYLFLNPAIVSTTIATWALNLAFLANPITWVVLGIGALVTAIVLLWRRSEAFRGFLFGLWEAVKAVFGGIGMLGKAVFGNLATLLNPVNWFSPDKMADAVRGLGNAFTTYGKDVADKFNAGFAEGSSQVRDKLAEGKGIKTPRVTPMLPGMTALELPGSASQGGKTGAVAKTSSDITGGGGKVNNFYITIQKLQDKTEITALTIKEGAAQAGDAMMEELTRAINGLMQLSR